MRWSVVDGWSLTNDITVVTNNRSIKHLEQIHAELRE